MNKSEYRLLSNACPAGTCPAVMEKDNEIVVIGSLLTSDEESDMKQSAKVGIASYERTVRIPRAVFDAAVNKILTEKANS